MIIKQKCLKQGDVGGPIVVMSSPGTWTVVGINSYTDQGKCLNQRCVAIFYLKIK